HIQVLESSWLTTMRRLGLVSVRACEAHQWFEQSGLAQLLEWDRREHPTDLGLARLRARLTVGSRRGGQPAEEVASHCEGAWMVEDQGRWQPQPADLGEAVAELNGAERVKAELLELALRIDGVR